MDKEITRVDSYEFDERFYTRIVDGKRQYRPSVTHKMSVAYPTDYGLINWRGDVGNKRAGEILDETSFLGTWVHEAIERILIGQEITKGEIRDTFNGKSSLKVLRCLQGFMEWMEEFKPTDWTAEFTTWNDGHNYAGTVDFKCTIEGETYIVDWKTSKFISEKHRMQISAYGFSEGVDKVALLHLGNTTKKKWSFLVLKEEQRTKHFGRWLAVCSMFETLFPNAKPNEETFPNTFKL